MWFLIKNVQVLHTVLTFFCPSFVIDSRQACCPFKFCWQGFVMFALFQCFTNTTGHAVLVFVWFAWILAVFAFAMQRAEPAARGHLSPPLTQPKTLPTCKSTVLKRSNDNTNIMQWIAERALEGNSYITVIRTASLKSLFKDTCFYFCMHTSNGGLSPTFYCSYLESTSLPSCFPHKIKWRLCARLPRDKVHNAIPKILGACYLGQPMAGVPVIFGEQTFPFSTRLYASQWFIMADQLFRKCSRRGTERDWKPWR